MNHGHGGPGRVLHRAPLAALAMLMAMLAHPTAGAAQASCDAPPDGVRILGAVEEAVTLTRAELRAMDPMTVEAIGHDDTVHTYHGPTLRAVLDRAGVPGGADLEGHLDGFVVIEARDGYTVTFALAELDGGYWDQLPILAVRRDGRSLTGDDYAGPFQVIAPDTPKHGRWVRQVACLRVGYADW